MSHTLVVCHHCKKVNKLDMSQAESKVPVCGNCGKNLNYHSGVQELDSESLEKLIRVADRPIVVDFWAEWCGPCRAFAPTFKSTATKYAKDLIFVKVNTEESPEFSQKLQIRGIPTLVVFNQGREVNRQSGAMPAQMFEEYLQPLVKRN